MSGFFFLVDRFATASVILRFWFSFFPPFLEDFYEIETQLFFSFSHDRRLRGKNAWTPDKWQAFRKKGGCMEKWKFWGKRKTWQGLPEPSRVSAITNIKWRRLIHQTRLSHTGNFQKLSKWHGHFSIMLFSFLFLQFFYLKFWIIIHFEMTFVITT